MVDRLIGLSVDWVVGARSRLSYGGHVFLRWLRAVTEDSAYECYQAANRGRPMLTAAEFYRQRVERKYSRPCRCC